MPRYGCRTLWSSSDFTRMIVADRECKFVYRGKIDKHNRLMKSEAGRDFKQRPRYVTTSVRPDRSGELWVRVEFAMFSDSCVQPCPVKLRVVKIGFDNNSIEDLILHDGHGGVTSCPLPLVRAEGSSVCQFDSADNGLTVFKLVFKWMQLKRQQELIGTFGELAIVIETDPTKEVGSADVPGASVDAAAVDVDAAAAADDRDRNQDSDDGGVDVSLDHSTGYCFSVPSPRGQPNVIVESECGTRSAYAHKSVLARHSHIFRNAFSMQEVWADKTEGAYIYHLRVCDISAKLLNQFLICLYAMDDNDSSSHLEDLVSGVGQEMLHLLMTLCIDGPLRNACEKVILAEDKINGPEDALDMLELAWSAELPMLWNSAVSYARECADEFQEMDKFEEMEMNNWQLWFKIKKELELDMEGFCI